MKWILLFAFGFCGCWGHESVDNKLTGQAKKVHHNTPLICPDYYSADISLGVMRNGVGSMSTQDVEVVISAADLPTFEKAALDGSVVDLEYNVKRLKICTTGHIATNVKIVQ